jgi:hypothetical protein
MIISVRLILVISQLIGNRLICPPLIITIILYEGSIDKINILIRALQLGLGISHIGSVNRVTDYQPINYQLTGF